MIMMFTQFAKQDIKIERCEMGKDKVRLFRWVISQKIAGSNVEFKYLLSVPAKLLLQMASTMLDDNIKRRTSSPSMRPRNSSISPTETPAPDYRKVA
jgi:hypothetical protein